MALWLGEGTLEELQELRERQVEFIENSKYVFTAISKEVAGNPLDEKYLYDLVRRLIERAGQRNRGTQSDSMEVKGISDKESDAISRCFRIIL